MSMPPLAPPVPHPPPFKFMTLTLCHSPYNLLTPFSAALMYVFRPDCFGLDNPWRTHPWRRLGLPFSVAMDFL